MAMIGNPWGERETELLVDLRPCCHTEEIADILNKLGYDRSTEAVSRKCRRLKIKFDDLDEPVGEFSDDESKVIDDVISNSPYRGKKLRERIAEDYNSPSPVSDESWPGPGITDYPVSEQKLPSDVDWLEGPLSIEKDKLTKFVLLNDVHVPHNINLEPIFEFIKDFQPDHVILNGDIMNMDPFNHWEKRSPRKTFQLPRPKPYYEECNEKFFRPLREVSGKNCQITYLLGNHENWVERAIDDVPDAEGYWEVWYNVDGVDKWVPWKAWTRIGKLYITHGDIIKGGKYHAHKMLMHFHRSVRYGHYHDVQEASETSAIDFTDRHTARACGCLEKYNPQFMQNAPHNWQHAFTYGYVRPDESFHDTTVVLVDEKFVVDGKEYK